MRDVKPQIPRQGRPQPPREQASHAARPFSIEDVIGPQPRTISGEQFGLLLDSLTNGNMSFKEALKKLNFSEAEIEDLLASHAELDISSIPADDADDFETVGQGGPVPEDDKDKTSGYNALAERLEDETRTFRQGVAARLLPALKQEMQSESWPHATYEQKVELVRWVKAELRRFDMAFRHPKTGLPATLNATPGNDHEIGSFELASKDAEGRRRTFTTPDLATLLDNLELMDAAPRREALAEWQAKVSRDRRGARRG